MIRRHIKLCGYKALWCPHEAIPRIIVYHQVFNLDIQRSIAFSVAHESISRIMSRRTLIGVGVAGLGAGTYYLYTAGGDPKVAKKEIERMFRAPYSSVPPAECVPRR